VARLAERLRADRWLSSGRYYQLNLVAGEHDNPEYRIGEDLRVAVEAPVDFASGILSAVLTAVTFVGVLWYIGGSLTIPWGRGRSPFRDSWSSPPCSTRSS
jgi:ABC-type uncharacterized transport system fused permease/ATPase subunit